MYRRKHEKQRNNTTTETEANGCNDEKLLKSRHNKRHNIILIICSGTILIAYIYHVTFLFHPIKKSDVMVKSTEIDNEDINDRKSDFKQKKDGLIYVDFKRPSNFKKVAHMRLPNRIIQANKSNLNKRMEVSSGFDIRQHLQNAVLNKPGNWEEEENVKVIKAARIKAHSDMKMEIDDILKNQSNKNFYTVNLLTSFLSFWKNPLWSKGVTSSETLEDKAVEEFKRAGVIVLGMHRSGTSMFTGVMKKGLGYYTGGPLMVANQKDNAKGYFERIDIVNQNDEFFQKQKISWRNNVVLYNSEMALKQIRDGQVKFLFGRPGLKFMNSVYSSPWIQKDPRMCITLPTWLALMESEPAIIFTYRHPLEVAESLARRGQILIGADDTGLSRGLWLWIIYNQKAIQDSSSLCRITTSQEAIMANPMDEINRVANELTTKCEVIAPKKKLTQTTIDEFIDENLHHNKHMNETVLTTYGTNCTVYSFTSDLKSGTQQAWREMELYLIAMKIYCDFKSGDAFRNDYVWPNLHSRRTMDVLKQ